MTVILSRALFLASLLVSGVWFVRCGGDAANSEGKGGVAALGTCATATFEPQWLGGRIDVSPADSSLVVPSGARVLAASDPDLNCDQQPDLVLQYRASTEPESTIIVFFVRDAGTLREIFRTHSGVDGTEGVVAAADVNRDGMSEIVTFGYDEGGLVSRIFVSDSVGFSELALPSQYRLSQRDEWDTACFRALAPRFGRDLLLILAREGSEDTQRHGQFTCAYPRDSIRINELKRRE